MTEHTTRHPPLSRPDDDPASEIVELDDVDLEHVLGGLARMIQPAPSPDVDLPAPTRTADLPEPAPGLPR